MRRHVSRVASRRAPRYRAWRGAGVRLGRRRRSSSSAGPRSSLTNVSETFFLKRVGVNRLPVVFLVNSLLLVGTTYVDEPHRGTRAGAAAAGPHVRSCSRWSLVPLWLLVLGRRAQRLRAAGDCREAARCDRAASSSGWPSVACCTGARPSGCTPPSSPAARSGEILGSFASGRHRQHVRHRRPTPGRGGGAGARQSCWPRRSRSLAPVRVARMRRRRRMRRPPAALALFAPLWRESRLVPHRSRSARCSAARSARCCTSSSRTSSTSPRAAPNGELRLLELYAHFRGFLNVGVLALQLIGTSRLFRRIGVPLASTLSPLVYLLGFFGMSMRLDLPSASARWPAPTCRTTRSTTRRSRS